MIQDGAIRVLVADAHEKMRDSLGVFLEAFDDLLLVGEATTCDDVIRLCREAAPHVILMDLGMPQLQGISTIRAVRESYPDVRVIALAGFGEQVLMHEALRVGAFCTLVKDASIDLLAEAIRSACGPPGCPRQFVADGC